MKLNSLVSKNSLKMIGNMLKKHSPAILTGFSIAGVISTAIMTARATSQAQLLLEDAEFQKKDLLTKQEVVETAWKCYIPPAILGISTIACIFGVNSIHAKRHAALAGLYSIAETSLKEYQTKILEEVGPKKAQKIADDIAQDRLNQNPLSKNDIYNTGSGDALCYDTMSGRYFKSDVESLKRAQNDFNHKLIHDFTLWMTLNEFYYEINLPSIRLGEYMGWTPQQMLDIRFATKLADDGQPCLVLDYHVEPRFLYDR